ncbi:hypothetical protein [Xanthomonas arboricola]|uniref:hypothetical protein n=1 Tax=Xanthomonas arboricola TaxID=56448 RepID=UPI000F8DB8C7|nr:hypothetical protein [Xanthomonas arboricola]
MKFVIERYAYFGTSYTLRLPLIPGLKWPYVKHDVGTRNNDDFRPDDEDAESAAKSIVAVRWLRYGKKAAAVAIFEFKDTYGS